MAQGLDGPLGFGPYSTVWLLTMTRRLAHLAVGLSLLLCVAVCVLWVRSRTVADSVSWTYYRKLADGGVAGDGVHLRSAGSGRMWLSASRGRVGPRPVNLVRGWDINAYESGGRPRFTFHRAHHDPLYLWALSSGIEPGLDGTSGFGPVRWQVWQVASAGERSRRARIGVSHWLLAVLFGLPPAWVACRGIARWRTRRERLRRGLCLICGYDLRATPERCPECGTLANAVALDRPDPSQTHRSPA